MVNILSKQLFIFFEFFFPLHWNSSATLSSSSSLTSWVYNREFRRFTRSGIQTGYEALIILQKLFTLHQEVRQFHTLKEKMFWGSIVQILGKHSNHLSVCSKSHIPPHFTGHWQLCPWEHRDGLKSWGRSLHEDRLIKSRQRAEKGYFGRPCKKMKEKPWIASSENAHILNILHTKSENFLTPWRLPMNPGLISFIKALQVRKKQFGLEIGSRRENIYKWEVSPFKGQKERIRRNGFGDGSEWAWLDSEGRGQAASTGII